MLVLGDKKPLAVLFGNMQINAKIIKDSINGVTGDRLTTFILVFPRMILAEFNTHRVISKNSASSRAIPYKKMFKMVKETPFIPLHFQEDHSGMQGSKYLTGYKLKIVRFLWITARNLALFSSYILHKLKVTKQLCNRILEPFMWHTVIATSTEWENFFALRYHKDAEIHIQELARLMLGEYNKSIPQIKYPQEESVLPYREIEKKEWHMPFEDQMPEGLTIGERLRVAIARCARLSYLSFDGEMDVKKDFAIYNKLFEKNPIHASPAEHVAYPISESTFIGNFRGWIQYRKLIPFENQPDPRVIKRKVVNGKVV